MDFIFGSDTNQQPTSKSKHKQLKTELNLKDDNSILKQLTPLQKFKLQAKKKLQNQENPHQPQQLPYQSNYQQKRMNIKNQPPYFQQQTNFNTAEFHQSFHNSQLQNLNSSPNQFQNLQLHDQTAKFKPINQLKPSPIKKTQNKSPVIPKKSNQLKVSLKPPVPKQINEQIKSVKQISPSKLQKQVKSIKSVQQISPKINNKKFQIKGKQDKKTPKIPEKSKIKQVDSVKKKAFSIQVKPKNNSIANKKFVQQPQKSQKSHINTKSHEKTKKHQQNNGRQLHATDLKSHLQTQLSHAERGMRFLDKKLIEDRLNDSENVVYTALASQKPGEYIKGVYQNIYPDNQFIKHGVDETVNNALQRINNIFDDSPRIGSKVSVQKRIAPKSKDDLKELQKLDKFRLIKIKEGQVKSKVGDLRTQLQKQYFIHQNLIKIDPTDSLIPEYYSMDHPQTIKAQNLIRSINKKRKSQHRQYQQYLSHKEMQREKISQIQKEYEEKLKQQRKQKLKEFYQQKHLQRQQQKLQQKKKQEEFKQWIKMYEREKPLEEKLQQEMVRKLIIPEIQDRHKKLIKIKEDHKPIDIEEINQHEKRYMDFKRDEMIRQRAQLQHKVENDSIYQEQSSRHFKGKYRYLVLESMYQQKNQTDPKEIERSKKQRQLAYSDQIRYVHQSLIKKKNEQSEDTRSLVRRVRNHNGSVGMDRNSHTIDVQTVAETDRPARRNAQTIDVYAQGLKNLQYVKSHVRQKLMNGERKKPKIQLLEIRQNHSYLDDLKQKRLHNSVPHKSHQSTKNNSTIQWKAVANDLSTANDVESLKARVEGMDIKLKRKEQKHKHVRDHKTLMDRQIEDDYLDSINAKLKMVQELK